MQLDLLGISHHRTPVELREQVALDPPAANELAARLAGGGGEAVCLSTCNRTELYLVDADAGAAAEALREGELEVYRLRDEAAALHLFRVAAGLDSLVPGEGEILGQVRAAYEGGVTGPVLDRLFRQALHAGRKARAQTAIGESPSSVSAAGAALAEQVFGDLRGRRIVLVGAGKVSELTARNLLSRGAEVAFVASRTLDHAAMLAARLGAGALPLERLAAELEHADVVVTSTSAPGFVLGRPEVERGIRGRRGRPLLFVDLAVPRDVDPVVTELEGCYLYDIDDLEAVVAETLVGRRREAERAEAIVSEEAERFRAWQASLEVVPAITSLRALAEEIRAGELARVSRRLSERELRAVEAATTAFVNKLLHLPTVRMKEAAATADGVLYADAVRRLFDLEDER